MTDLQPWKIWAVTSALVCTILGTTAARVRPQPSDEASALAAAVSSAEHTTRVTTASSASSDNQNDAYAFYTPHKSINGAGYASCMASPITPVSNLLYGSAATSAIPAEDYQETLVDVAQQILGNQESAADLVAANEGQPSQTWDLPLFYAAGDQVREDMFADVPEDHLAYGSVQDASQMLTFTFPPPQGDGFVVLDQPVPMDTPVNDLTLRNVVLNVAINGSDSNVTMNVVSATNGYVVTGIPPTITDGEAVELPLNLAMSAELNVELGDEQEDLVKARPKELLVEAQAQLQAAQQQRAEAIYTATLGRLYAVKSGVVSALSPDD